MVNRHMEITLNINFQGNVNQKGIDISLHNQVYK